MYALDIDARVAPLQMSNCPRSFKNSN